MVKCLSYVLTVGWGLGIIVASFMILPIIALIVGLLLLIWSADRFVDGSAATAKYFGMPALLIGMVVVGFGTSAPEMVVSALSAMNGSPEIALGNAYGSNITNIALILGITALIGPIAVGSKIISKELPLLIAVTGLSAFLLWDNDISRMDAAILLVVFALLMGWTIVQGVRNKGDAMGEQEEAEIPAMSIQKALMWLVLGLGLLIASSQMLVYGAVEIATALGVDQLIIGLTVVAIGTSLPELASSVAAARKGEHDIAVGNIIGSNFFNTLAVVGIAGVIKPMHVGAEVFSRDMLVMVGLTLFLFVVGFSWRKGHLGRINRLEGGMLLTVYIAYTAYLVYSNFI